MGGGAKKQKHLDDFVSAENEPKEFRSFEGGKFVKHNDNFNEFIERRRNIFKINHSRLLEEDAFFSVCALPCGTGRQKSPTLTLVFFLFGFVLLVFVCFISPNSGPASRHTSLFFKCSVLYWWN